MVSLLCLLLLVAPIPLLSSTLSLQTRPSVKTIAQFLVNDNFTAGLMTDNLYLSYDFPPHIQQNWHLLDANENISALIQEKHISHIVITKRYIQLEIRPVISRILLGCAPALVVPDPAGRHLPSIYEDEGAAYLSDPLTEHMYVFRAKDVVATLRSEGNNSISQAGKIENITTMTHAVGLHTAEYQTFN